jgi:hypothetical protein
VKRDLLEDGVRSNVLIDLDGGPTPGGEGQQLRPAQTADWWQATLKWHREVPFNTSASEHSTCSNVDFP